MTKQPEAGTHGEMNRVPGRQHRAGLAPPPPSPKKTRRQALPLHDPVPARSKYNYRLAALHSSRRQPEPSERRECRSRQPQATMIRGCSLLCKTQDQHSPQE